MLYAEHLIENAISTLEDNKEYEAFAGDKCNIEMAQAVNIDLEQIWTMATYVVYTLRPILVSDTIAVMTGEQPFLPYMMEYVKQFLGDKNDTIEALLKSCGLDTIEQLWNYIDYLENVKEDHDLLKSYVCSLYSKMQELY